MNARLIVGCLATSLLLACVPALDWREFQVNEAGVKALLPCKPDRQARQVRLAGRSVQLVLWACIAGGATWAVAEADMIDPDLVATAMLELRAAAARNLGSTETPRSLSLRVAGATPNPYSVRLVLQGRMPDGRSVTEQMAVFARDTRVFQATVLGETLRDDAADMFFGNLRAVP